MARAGPISRKKDKLPADYGRRTNVAQETEARVLAVALDLFADWGFDRVSTRAIANAAGVTVPTIYLYFEDKQDLYLKSCIDVFDRNSDILSEAIKQPGTRSERLFHFVRTLATMLFEDRHLSKLFLRETLQQQSGRLNMLASTTFQKSFLIFQELLDEAVEESDAHVPGISVYALVFGLIQFRQLGDLAGQETLDITRSPEALAAHVLSTMTPNTWKAFCAERDNPKTVVRGRTKRRK